MAVEYKFTCNESCNDFLEVKSFKENDKENPNWLGKFVRVSIYNEEIDCESIVILDIPTAIKFAKTLRTEINKAKEGGINV